MFKPLALALWVLATPALAQSYKYDAPLRDANGDGVIETKAAGKAVRLRYLGPCGSQFCYERVDTRGAVEPISSAKGARPRENGETGAGDGDSHALAIAAPAVTTASRDFGGNGQWTYANRPGVYGNVHALQAMDMIPIRTPASAARIIENVQADATRSFITTQAKKGPNLAVDNVTVRRVEAASRKRGIYIRGNSGHWLIEDFRLRGIGINTRRGDIPVGIALNGSHDVTIQRGEVSGFLSNHASGYTNADGVSSERIDRNLTIRDVFSHDNTDGCYDLKSTDTRLENTRAARCRYNYRLWGTGTATTLFSDNPKAAHIQINSAMANWRIRLLVARSTGVQPLIKFEDPNGVLVVERCELALPKDTPIVVGGGKVTLGPGCD
jgi:hypothetical protein